MKYMLSKAMVAESIVWFCSEACPELLEEMQKANSHFQATLLEAEAVMSSRGIQSAHLDWQTPERLKRLVARSQLGMARIVKDPHAFCSRHIGKMNSATTEDLVEKRIAELKGIDEEARAMPIISKPTEEGA